jgi:hypothetical protein
MRLRVLCTLFLATLIAAPLFLVPAAAFADSYDVTAEVMAPLPPEQPVMVTPGDNTTQTTSTVTITGTCPVVVPALIVVLLRDGVTIGSGSCDSLGIFRINVALVLGVNIIYAKFTTITGESGGVGYPITITYKSPGITPVDGTPKNTTVTAKITPPSKDGLKLVFNYDTVVIKTKETTNLEFIIQSGIGPYKVVIDWGDGSSSVYTYDTAGSKALSHIYTKIQNRPMRIAIQVTDAAGVMTKQERALVSFERPTLNAPASLTNPANSAAVALWIILVVCSLVAVAMVYQKVYKSLGTQPAKAGPIARRRSLVAIRSKRKPKPRKPA